MKMKLHFGKFSQNVLNIILSLKWFLQDVLQPASDFFEVTEEQCRHKYHEEINEWPLIDPRNIICEGQEDKV